MKCLIFSDSHGSIRNVESVLSMHSDAEVVFFLGDGLSEIDLIASKHPDKFWIAVSLQTPDSSLSDEAIRVLKTSPKWTPGKQRNQTVRVKYTLPIDFRIQN